MKTLESILRLFGNNATLASGFENHLRVELTSNLTALSVPSEHDLGEEFTKFSSEDDFTLDITIGSSDAISLYRNTFKYNDFKERLQKGISLLDSDDVIQLKITVHKKEQIGKLNIYDSKSFWSFFLSQELPSQLGILNKLLQKGDLAITCLDGVVTFSTSNILCSNVANIDSMPATSTNKEKRIESIASICHYANISEFKLLPEEFRMLKKSEDSNVNKYFDRLSLLHCMISLFDITSIQGQTINYKLNGFKSYSGSFVFNDLQSSSLSDYYKIYEWTYEGGNLSDKVGLSRNIISIHTSEDKIFNLSGSPYHSIRSGYEIYLKQNIKQYIEIRNKINDQLGDFSKKANTIVDEFAKSFKTSVFTFISFFISVFVLRVLSTGNFKNVLPLEAAIICIGFLVISVIFLYYSKWELREQKDRFEKGYSNLKVRYRDLLVEGDINKILNNDKDHLEDLSFVAQKEKIYTALWGWVLGVSLILIVILFCVANFSVLKSTLSNFQ
jgi:hypothetical protein